MNQRKFLPLLLLLAMSLTACLDEHPKDRVDEDALYSTPQNIYINAVASLYNYIGGAEESQGLQGTCRGVYDYNTLTTDEAIIPIRGGDWYDGGLWNAMYQHKWTANDGSLYDTWAYLYKVVVLADKSLDVIAAHSKLLSEAQRQAYEAEVRAIRAMMYYYLMDLFGRVPINGQEQSERSVVFHHVFNELQEVAPYLPDRHSNLEGDCYGRITRPVVNFLLAKLALNAEIYTYDNWTAGYDQRPKGDQIFFKVEGQWLNAWQTCIHYCDALAAEGYTLESDYAYNFSTHNENSRENIFTIPMDKSLYAAQFHYLFRSFHYKHGGALGWGTENGTCATISTMRANHYGQPDEDARCRLNFVAGKVTVDGQQVTLDDGTPLEYQPFEVEQNLTNSEFILTAGARMGKYEVDRTAYMDGKQQSNDIVLYRYADVLLMKAEAKTRNGEDGQAELNAVRARVGMPARACTLDNVLEERLLELVWEGWRRQDLIRFGRFTQAYDLHTPVDNEQTGFTIVFPIPQKCLDLNPKFQQNPGY